MTEEIKPVVPATNADGAPAEVIAAVVERAIGEGVNLGDVSGDSANYQPTIDTNQAGATEAYGEGSIQILEGLERMPEALISWYKGANSGVLMVKISDDE